MALNSLTNECVQSIVFPYFLGWITEGIGTILFVSAIIVFIVILKQKRKSELRNLLIYHNRKPKPEIQTTKQWQKAKDHIEKLLYEITENRQVSDFLKDQSKNSDEQFDYEVIGRKPNELMPERQTEHENSTKQSNQPLNVHELRAVALLAKQLQTNNQSRTAR